MTAYLTGALVGLGAGLAIAVAALFGVWLERKVSARLQLRYGPTELGPAGLLQTLADTVKLVLKEDITPERADVPLFRVAPLLVFVPIAMSLSVIPMTSRFVALDTEVGMLFFLAIPSVSVLGVLLGGWASRNTYATIGSMRGAAQMISYEIPRSLAVLSVALLAGSLRPLQVAGEWRVWWIPVTAIGFVVYVVSSIAELNRGPFDLPEAESELVAGYFADYSGIRWAIFMMAEYGGLLAASAFGAFAFLGGAAGLPGVAGVGLFALEIVALVVLMMWVKWTFPRMRADQLMDVAWKVLTPMALVQLLIVAGVVAWL